MSYIREFERAMRAGEITIAKEQISPGVVRQRFIRFYKITYVLKLILIW
jgi:hypothetical protein